MVKKIIVKRECSLRFQEAIWLYNALREYPPEELSPCINIGSSTKYFRHYSKPHISKYVINPLLASGIKLINFDLKEGDGIDISGDIYDKVTFDLLKKINSKALICSNMLEHIMNRRLFAKKCSALLGNNGLIFITVPYSYPYHRDPIDTLYRPKPEDIINLFPEFSLVKSEIITASSYFDDLKKAGSIKILMRAGRLLLPIYKPKSWISHLHRLLWLFRPYTVTCVVLQKSKTQ